MTTQPPLSQQIAESLARRIRSGELAPGDRLPSTRELAAAWGVGMMTAVRAYRRLHAEGLIIGQPGRGRYVAGCHGGRHDPRPDG